ncbi:MAG: hypothetical protein LBI13_07095 [Streptococcaceae bacterium]|nr:hypothetical protein [Streptococcaceae bacterium]
MKNTKILLSGVGNLARFVDIEDENFYFTHISQSKKIFPITIFFLVCLASVIAPEFPNLNLFKERVVILIGLLIIFVIEFTYVNITLREGAIHYHLDTKMSLFYKKKMLKRGMYNFWLIVVTNLLFITILIVATINFYQSGDFFSMIISLMSTFVLAVALALQKRMYPLSHYLSMKKILKKL